MQNSHTSDGINEDGVDDVGRKGEGRHDDIILPLDFCRPQLVTGPSIVRCKYTHTLHQLGLFERLGGCSGCGATTFGDTTFDPPPFPALVFYERGRTEEGRKIEMRGALGELRGLGCIHHDGRS